MMHCKSAKLSKSFHNTTIINFTIPKEEVITVRIFNSIGELVKILSEGRRYRKGEHALKWFGDDRYGNSVASGTYLCQLTTGS